MELGVLFLKGSSPPPLDPPPCLDEDMMGFIKEVVSMFTWDGAVSEALILRLCYSLRHGTTAIPVVEAVILYDPNVNQHIYVTT